MKGLKILILGVNNIGVSISILLNRLGYSYFVSSLETMKLHLFKEGLIPIANKDLKDTYINENVHPSYIDELENEYDIVFNTESGFNTFKFLKEHKVKLFIINAHKNNDYLSLLYETFKDYTSIIYWPDLTLVNSNIIGVHKINDLRIFYELLGIYDSLIYKLYDYKIINEVIEYQKKVDKIYLGYLNLLQEKNYDSKQISEFEEIIKNKNSQ